MMMPAADLQPWQIRAAELQALSGRETDLGTRMRILCDALLGTPYVSCPLSGGPAGEEKLILRLDGFDCVTFIESILALARSRSTGSFMSELRKTRYRNGEIKWSERLHYFSDWLDSNQRRGAIRVRTAGEGARNIHTRLGVLPDLPERSVELTVVPKQYVHRLSNRLKNGSLVAFASLRKGLDYFHTGFLFTRDAHCTREQPPLLFHASRSRGQVVAEPFRDFLSRNRMRGISFAEPLPEHVSRKE